MVVANSNPTKVTKRQNWVIKKKKRKDNHLGFNKIESSAPEGKQKRWKENKGDGGSRLMLEKIVQSEWLVGAVSKKRMTVSMPCRSCVGQAKKERKKKERKATLLGHRSLVSHMGIGVWHVSDTSTLPKMVCRCNLASNFTNSLVSPQVNDCRLLATQIHQICFKHCFREANRSADRLDRMGAVQESQFFIFFCVHLWTYLVLLMQFNGLYLSRKCPDSPETIFVP